MKVVHIISGGIDSTTLLYELLLEQHQVECITFNYGQKHKKEIEMAKKTCKKLNVNQKIVNITTLLPLLNSALTSKQIEIPEGHYKDSTMKLTVVPNRNMIFSSIAIEYAVSLDYDAISLGVHAGDHTIYPDCRPEFIDALQNVANVSNYKKITILRPYLFLDKIDIVKRGIHLLNVDYSLTWTCYKGKEKPCQKCGSCIERIEAFKKNNTKDPL